MTTESQFKKILTAFNQSLFFLDPDLNDRLILPYAYAHQMGKVEALAGAYKVVLRYRERFEEMDRNLLIHYLVHATVHDLEEFEDLEDKNIDVELDPELIQYRRGLRKRLTNVIDYEQELRELYVENFTSNPRSHAG